MKEELFAVPFKGYTVELHKYGSGLRLWVQPIICAHVSLTACSDSFSSKVNNVEFITLDYDEVDSQRFLIDEKNNVSDIHEAVFSIENNSVFEALRAICRYVAYSPQYEHYRIDRGIESVSFDFGSPLGCHVERVKKSGEKSLDEKSVEQESHYQMILKRASENKGAQ